MLKKIAEKLLMQDNILIISHENPDGDALGSSFALKFALESLGKKADVVLNSNLPVSFRFTGWLPKLFSNELSSDCTVALDFNSIDRAGDAGVLFEKAKTKILIDHHLDCKIIDGLIESKPEAAATGELVYELIKLLTPEVSKDCAEGIYIAIMTDTGGCRYSNTTATTHRILSEIIEKIDNAYLSRMALEIVSREKLEIQKFALNNFEFYKNGEICSISINKAMMKNEDLLNGIVNMAVNIENVKAGILFKEKDANETKVSLRTVGNIDAKEICALFGGGGHKNASGCTINQTISIAKEKFINTLFERI